MKILSTVLGLTGAIMLAMNIGLTLAAYLVMLVSSGIIAVMFWKGGREVAILHAGFSLINILGIIRFL
ncbi:hypothetical protein EBZ38_06490 [bacterium]|nr:hypothetical protein [bacterium]NDD83909.1 hypothetical protein [bacterium]